MCAQKTISNEGEGYRGYRGSPGRQKTAGLNLKARDEAWRRYYLKDVDHFLILSGKKNRPFNNEGSKDRTGRSTTSPLEDVVEKPVQSFATFFLNQDNQMRWYFSVASHLTNLGILKISKIQRCRYFPAATV